MSQKKATRRNAVGKKAPRKKAAASQEIHKDLEVIAFSTDKRWLSWIAKNYEREAGIWLKFAKKGSGIKTVTYEQAREGAIIYGWIDGLINKYDEQYYLVRFTPRRARSKWSKINREIAEQLIKAKKVQPSGLAQVKAAKADGRWAAIRQRTSKYRLNSKNSCREIKRPGNSLSQLVRQIGTHSFIASTMQSERPRGKSGLSRRWRC